jgi:hypothetical protein
VSERTSSIEDLLKVILTPIDPPEGLIETYLFLFEKDGDIYDFQRLLDLKVRLERKKHFLKLTLT